MAEMNSPHVHSGSQPASGGMNSGSVTGGFEVVNSSMGMGGGAGVSPPVSTVGGLSMTDSTLEQALARVQDLMRENAELREYLKENNEMMSQWKQVHDANVLEQMQALITALRSENEELLVKVKDSRDKEKLNQDQSQEMVELGQQMQGMLAENKQLGEAQENQTGGKTKASIKSSKKEKFYAVSCGRKIGIFKNWNAASESVTGYPKAIYKAYNSQEEALAAMREVGHDNPPIYDSGCMSMPKTQPLLDQQAEALKSPQTDAAQDQSTDFDEQIV